MGTDIWITVTALVFLLTGVALALYALKFRTTEHPMTMFEARNWIPVWKMRSWYTPKGYWLNLIGVVLVSASGLVVVIRNLLR